MSGTVLISLNRQDKEGAAELAGRFADAGFHIMATGETCRLIAEAGIEVEKVNKLYEGRPNITDHITNGKIQLIINSPSGRQSIHDDSYIRKAAIKARIPYITTMAAAQAAADGIHELQSHGSGELHSLQEWHSLIREK